jgi:NAD(P)-dependent dehydrogenase (short-subunit alcohol dehydrogenase family)
MSKANALRRLGTPKDVSRVMARLASVDSHWISGATIEATGALR